MRLLENQKRGQGLPLNVIVVAILVIIVLVIIVLFFVTKFGEQGKKVDETSKYVYDNCDKEKNPLIGSIYSEVSFFRNGNCDGREHKKIPGTNCCGKI